jgi:hypothetical protein
MGGLRFPSSGPLALSSAVFCRHICGGRATADSPRGQRHKLRLADTPADIEFREVALAETAEVTVGAQPLATVATASVGVARPRQDMPREDCLES